MPNILQRLKRRMQSCTSRVFCNRTNLADDMASTSEQKNPSSSSQIFASSSIALRVQKKLASKLSNRNVAKLMLSDSANRLFDNFYDVLKERYPKKEAEKVCSNMIKLLVKLGLVSRNDALSIEEHKLLLAAQRKIHLLALTAISFHQVAFSYERVYFIAQLEELKDLLMILVKHHLSGKSTKRVEYTFDHLMDAQLLDELFKVNGSYSSYLSEMVKDLENLLDEKNV